MMSRRRGGGRHIRQRAGVGRHDVRDYGEGANMMSEKGGEGGQT